MMRMADMVSFRTRLGLTTAALLLVPAVGGPLHGASADRDRPRGVVQRILAPPPIALALQQPATEEFVPVKDLPPQEQLPAAPLLVTAYAVVWVVLIGYVVLLWRRLTRVERELAGVARRLEEDRRS
jgi:CcmD family protein